MKIKITVKPFVNTRLGKKVSYTHPYLGKIETTNPGYPVYIQITYRRKTTHIKSQVAGYYSDLSDLSPQDNYQLKKECKAIYELTAYLVKLFDNRHDKKKEDIIPNFKIYYQQYCQQLDQLIIKGLLATLFDVIERCNSEFYELFANNAYGDIKFKVLLKSARGLHPNFDSQASPDEKSLFNFWAKYSDLIDLNNYEIDGIDQYLINWIVSDKTELIKSSSIANIKNNEVDSIVQFIDKWIKEYMNYNF